MIISPKGKRMIESISPIYGRSKIMQAIIQSIGIELDNVDRLSDEVLAQIFPQTATWGNVYWEELLKIKNNKSLPLEIRRARVMAKLQIRWPMTRQRMEQIINQFIPGKNAKIEQASRKYAFRAHIPLGDIAWFFELCEMLEDVKPAHLRFSPMALWRGVLAYIVRPLRPKIALQPELGSLLDCGYWPFWSSPGTVLKRTVGATPILTTGMYTFPYIGAGAGSTNKVAIELTPMGATGTWVFPVSSIPCGLSPKVNSLGSLETASIIHGIAVEAGVYQFPYIGAKDVNINTGIVGLKNINGRLTHYTGFSNYARCGNYISGQEVA